MDHIPEPLQWIRPPRQARTQESLERLLDAANHLLRDKGFEDIHVAEVARLAGTSVASFYRRFPDKDALLHALHERFCEEAFATADNALAPARWQDAGIDEILSEVFAFLVDTLKRHEALDRAIYQRAMSDALMHERASRLTRYVVVGLSELLEARSAEISHPTPKLAISFALVQALALLVQHYTVGFREIELVHPSDEELARQLTLSCLAYLGVREPTHIQDPLRGENP